MIVVNAQMHTKMKEWMKYGPDLVNFAVTQIAEAFLTPEGLTAEKLQAIYRKIELEKIKSEEE